MQQQALLDLGSSILLLVILAYGFAVMLGKTRELNKLLKDIASTIFSAVLRILDRLFHLLWEELRKLHQKCLARNRKATILVEAGLVVGIVLFLILRGGKG